MFSVGIILNISEEKLSVIIMNLVKIDPIQVINMDCLNIIFSYLDPTSMKKATLVSRLMLILYIYIF